MLCSSCTSPEKVYLSNLELKLIYPEENFPLDPNILMVTILKMQSDIEINTVSDGFNISLSTADCIKNMGNDISSLYLPAAEDNPGLSSLLKSLRSSDELVRARLS